MTDERPLAELVGELRAEQRRRWMEGDRVPVEDLLEQNPRLLADTERALELVYGEVLLREELGEVTASWKNTRGGSPRLPSGSPRSSRCIGRSSRGGCWI